MSYSIGDEVECIYAPGDTLTVGKTYRVSGAVIDDKSVIGVFNDSKRYQIVAAEYFKPVSKHEFKVGDEVECVSTGFNCYITAGKRYVVLGVSSYCGVDYIKIRNNYDEDFSYSAQRFKPVSKPEPEFKAGDLVECVEADRHLTKGKTYTVFTSERDNKINTIGDLGTVVRRHVSLFKPMPKSMNAFDVGEKVICIDSKGSDELTVGNVYTISKCWFMGVNLKETQEAIYSPARFEKYSLKRRLEIISDDMTTEWAKAIIDGRPSWVDGNISVSHAGWELELTKHDD